MPKALFIEFIQQDKQRGAKTASKWNGSGARIASKSKLIPYSQKEINRLKMAINTHEYISITKKTKKT